MTTTCCSIPQSATGGQQQRWPSRPDRRIRSLAVVRPLPSPQPAAHPVLVDTVAPGAVDGGNILHLPRRHRKQFPVEVGHSGTTTGQDLEAVPDCGPTAAEWPPRAVAVRSSGVEEGGGVVPVGGQTSRRRSIRSRAKREAILIMAPYRRRSGSSDCAPCRCPYRGRSSCRTCRSSC